MKGDAVIRAFIFEPVRVKPLWVGEILRVIVKSNLGWVRCEKYKLDGVAYDGDDNSGVGRNDKV